MANSNLGRCIHHHDRVFPGCPQHKNSNSATVPRLGHVPLPHSPVTLSFDGIYALKITTPLRKLQGKQRKENRNQKKGKCLQSAIHFIGPFPLLNMYKALFLLIICRVYSSALLAVRQCEVI